jgi:sulfotransferase 6B1
MSVVQALRRKLRPAGKTLQAVIRWKRLSFLDAPPVFGNAKPKSGSHLLLQVLQGLTQIMPLAYVRAEPIRSITKDGRRRSAQEILDDLGRIPRGVVGWGYLDPTAENVGSLCRPDRVNYFLYRDPRDLLVSQVFFATDMYEDHGMHAYYNALPDFASRLNAAIAGVEQDGLKMVSVRQRYEGVLQWLKTRHVLCLRFEDFINRPDEAFDLMLDEVEKTGYRIPTPRPEARRILRESIQPRKSRTFRSGKVGGWREHFSPEHKRLFLSVAGDLLVRLGYENGDEW